MRFLLYMISSLVAFIASIIASTASCYVFYQPKEPKCLKKASH